MYLSVCICLSVYTHKEKKLLTDPEFSCKKMFILKKQPLGHKWGGNTIENAVTVRLSRKEVFFLFEALPVEILRLDWSLPMSSCTKQFIKRKKHHTALNLCYIKNQLSGDSLVRLDLIFLPFVVFRKETTRKGFKHNYYFFSPFVY